VFLVAFALRHSSGRYGRFVGSAHLCAGPAR